MAPLGLPPGPYFTAFMANGGLRYTDGFNYHYYGYASDFTGVYRQFQDAVTKPPESAVPPVPANVAILSTRFYPNISDWTSVPIFNFDFPAADAASHRTQLESRPLAEGEPKLTPQGRWLVSSGVTVEERPGVWRIRVEHLPTEPLRPAMAELPLPDNLKTDPNALLSFFYRVVTREELEAGGRTPEARGPDDQRAGKPESRKPAALEAQPSAPLPSRSPSSDPNSQFPTTNYPASRSLPILLTEYGYGLLSKEARDTAEGRARQTAWFEQVQNQIHALGLTHAMAFLLKPYLENDRQEFGLLMKAEAGGQTPEAGRPDDLRAGGSDGQKAGTPESQTAGTSEGQKSRGSEASSDHPLIRPSAYRPQSSVVRPPASVLRPQALWPSGLPVLRPSSALSALITDSATPISARSWSTSEPQPQTPIVIDFIAGAGLNQQKSYIGYLVRGDYGRPGQPASGCLVLYNFGTSAVTGDLQLTGDSWTLADASRTTTLTLAPGERRELPVLVTPAPLFAPQPVTATFRPSSPPSAGVQHPASETRPPPYDPLASGIRPPVSVANPKVRAIATAEPGQLPFDVYLRTADGNLFSLGSQLAATATPERRIQRIGNLSPAFFSRAELPWSFDRNKPASLVFFLRPSIPPASLEVSFPQLAEFRAP